ncbi:MAG: bifunctional diguanylate cyclase/phosphodiesterase [Candidatus Eremiobacteraeota bacterium]|nr:bifunctional diguanylate cyclase/phosphodiesterase [Candidatus Eremiobacteraeota bacterium]
MGDRPASGDEPESNPPGAAAGLSLLDHLPGFIWRTNTSLTFTYVGGSVARIRNSAARYLGKHISHAMVQASPYHLIQDGHERALRGESVEYECTASGRTFGAFLEPIFEDGKITGVSGVAHDFTARKASESLLRNLSLHDELTSLPNRRRFAQILGEMIDKSACLEIISIDIIGMHSVNDTFGHAFGDALLQSVANRLMHLNIEESRLARVGGAEFIMAIVVPNGETSLGSHIAYGAFKEPFYVEGREMYVNAHVGICKYPDHAQDVDTLIHNADIAVTTLRGEGGTGVKQFTPDMRRDIERRVDLEQALRHAVDRGELELHYQPIVDTDANAIIGTEALLRWNHPTEGLLMPDMFIPVAEGCAQIGSLGEWVLQEACAQNHRWHEMGFRNLRICVNVSAKQLINAAFVHVIRGALLGSFMNPASLEIEFTESAAMSSLAETAELIRVLRSMGVRTAIDDFGTGHSSLAYVKQLQTNTIKIDRLFIREIEHDRASRAIATAIINVGKELGTQIVAEGIETEAQAHLLRKIGCYRMQGYLYCRPAPAATITEMLLQPTTSWNFAPLAMGELRDNHESELGSNI